MASGRSPTALCASFPAVAPAARAPPCRPRRSPRRRPVRRSSRAGRVGTIVDPARVERLDPVPLRHARGAPAPARCRSPAGRGAGRSGRRTARPGRARTRPACRRRATSAYSTACQAVGRMSDRNRYRSSRPVRADLDRPVVRPAAPAGIPPAHRAPSRRARCSRTAPRPCPAPGPGWSRTATAAPVRHMQQCPQEMLNGMTTRSPGRDVGDLGADLLDDAHRLVAEDVALRQVRAEHLVQVQVRAADGRRGDPDDGVRRLLR